MTIIHIHTNEKAIQTDYFSEVPVCVSSIKIAMRGSDELAAIMIGGVLEYCKEMNIEFNMLHAILTKQKIKL